MEEDFEEFINTRFNNNYSKLLEINDYKETDKKMGKIQDLLLENLDCNQKKQLEEFIILRNILTNYEVCLSYKLGFCDFLKILK